MRWTTDGITKLVNEIENGRDIKSILREISIETILSDSDSEPTFPFYYGSGDVALNFNLRARNILYHCTSDEMMEYGNYMRSPMELYKMVYSRYVTHQYNSKKDFNIFDHEQIWINNYLKSRFNMFLSPRQMGSTDLIAFCVIHYIIKESDRRVVVYDRNDFFMKFMCMYECLPFFMKPGIVDQEYHETYYEIIFDNGCRVLCTDNITDIIGPGYGIDFTIINKPKINNDFKEVMNVIIPAVSSLSLSRIMIRLSNDEIEYFNSYSGVMDKISFMRTFNLNYLLS